jgi:hypothetical protein
LTPASRATFCHRAISSRMNASTRCGVEGEGSAPSPEEDRVNPTKPAPGAYFMLARSS